MDSRDTEFENVGDVACPWAYPLLNHSSTILLAGGNGQSSMSIDFDFVVKDDPNKLCMKLEAKMSTIEAIVSIGQLKELLKFNKYVHEMNRI